MNEKKNFWQNLWVREFKEKMVFKRGPTTPKSRKNKKREKMEEEDTERNNTKQRFEMDTKKTQKSILACKGRNK